jgi:TonB family protein
MRALQGGHGTLAGGAPAQADGGAGGGSASEPGRLQAVKVAETRVIRQDTQAKPLDVLAPSTFCPLPLPGHTFPNNRPPKPDGTDHSVPTYAQDNPSFIFPLQALLANVQGNPIVRVEVLPDGKPGRMWLKQSSGNGMLDRDAQSQLTFWRFNPARKNGQPVAAWIDVPVVYRLQDAKK